MPRKTKLIVASSFGAFVLAIVVGMLAGIPVLQPGVLVVVQNSDPDPIANVQVLVGGKTIGLGGIAPGDSASGWAIPSADSDVAIQYVDASGAQQSVRVDTYVTGGYRGRVDAEIRDGTLVSFRTRLY